VILPHILPALLTGFAMAFARAIGEYGSVIFIAGNMPMVSEITPLIIIGKLEQYDYAGATAVAVVMLVSPSSCCWSSTAAGLAAPRELGGTSMSGLNSLGRRQTGSAAHHRTAVGALDADRHRRWPSWRCFWCCHWRRCLPKPCARAGVPTGSAEEPDAWSAIRSR
jgi:hypothetical protein